MELTQILLCVLVAAPGLAFLGLALGWLLGVLALFHILGHATVRTLQFVSAPSMLHDYHQLRSAAGGPLSRTGEHYDTWQPLAWRLWLYRFAMDRGHLDSAIDRGFGGPLHAVSSWLGRPSFGTAQMSRAKVASVKPIGGLD